MICLWFSLCLHVIWFETISVTLKTLKKVLKYAWRWFILNIIPSLRKSVNGHQLCLAHNCARVDCLHMQMLWILYLLVTSCGVLFVCLRVGILNQKWYFLKCFEIQLVLWIIGKGNYTLRKCSHTQKKTITDPKHLDLVTFVFLFFLFETWSHYVLCWSGTDCVDHSSPKLSQPASSSQMLRLKAGAVTLSSHSALSF